MDGTFRAQEHAGSGAGKVEGCVGQIAYEATVQRRFADIGAAIPKPDRRGGEYMLKLIGSEIDRWGDILKKAGVELSQ